jgi:hypothetical protein
VLSKDDCGGWSQKEGATTLAEKYNDNLGKLGLDEDTWNLTCPKAWPDFAWSGSANKLLFFARDWSAAGKCKAVTW